MFKNSFFIILNASGEFQTILKYLKKPKTIDFKFQKFLDIQEK